VATANYPRFGRVMSAGQLELAIRQAGLDEIPPEAVSQIAAYLDLLLKWNSRVNLTSIREPGAIIQRHFLECIQCAQILPEIPDATLLDYGSGAGFPGIPIAICRPEIRVTLAESQRKKAAFLREAVRSLGLTTEVFDGRVEEMPQGRRVSFVALRAVDKMAQAAAAAVSRVAPDGRLVIFTTKGTEAGLKAVIPEIEWRDGLPIAGTAHGEILIGQKRYANVPRGTNPSNDGG
jgi:16S rRNA (guanine527-N7)-methyltransferase